MKSKNAKTDEAGNIKIILLCIGMVIIGVGLGILINKPKMVPKLKDGKEVVARLDGFKLSAEDLFEELKKQTGQNVMTNLVDEYIANKEITDDTEAKEHADSYIKSLKAQYESYEETFEEALHGAGFETEEDLAKLVIRDFKINQAAEKYIKENEISNKEIKNYYNKNIEGALTVRYILVKPENTDDMTSEQVTEAEATALARAEEVINKLKKGGKFEDLAKEYSDDESTASAGGLYSNILKKDVVEEFWKAAVALKDNKYTTKPVKSSYGYFVILRIKQDKKASLEESKEEILTALTKEKTEADADLTSKVWIKIRKAYKLEIIDTEIKKAYDKVVKDLNEKKSN